MKLKLFLGLFFSVLFLVLTACSPPPSEVIIIKQERSVYGGLSYFNVTGETFSFASPSTYYNFSGGECALNNSVLCADSTLTVVEDGVYLVSYRATGDGDNNNKYITGVAINNVVIDDSRDIMIVSATGDTHKMGEELISNLYSGDKINLQVQNHGGTGNGKLYEWDMNILRIGNIQ